MQCSPFYCVSHMQELHLPVMVMHCKLKGEAGGLPMQSGTNACTQSTQIPPAMGGAFMKACMSGGTGCCTSTGGGALHCSDTTPSCVISNVSLDKSTVIYPFILWCHVCAGACVVCKEKSI